MFIPKVLIATTSKFHYNYICQAFVERNILTATVASSPSLNSIIECRNRGILPPAVFWIYMIISKVHPNSFLIKYLRYFCTAEAKFNLWISLLIFTKPILLITVSHMGWVKRGQGCFHIVDVPLAHPFYVHRILSEEYSKLSLLSKYYQNSYFEKLNLNEHQSILSADLVTVPSVFVRTTLIEYGIPPQKIRILPYGCNLSKRLDKLDYSEDSYDENSFRILFVGGLSVRKGLHVLLEAFQLLNIKNKVLTLIGPYSWDSLPIIKKFNNSSIRILGKIPHDELTIYYRNSDCFVLPSLAEGLAMVLGEALANGLPIIATPSTGIEDLIEDARCFINIQPNCVKSLTNALMSLACDRVRINKMREHCLQESLRHNGWNKYKQAWVDMVTNENIFK